MAEKYSSAQMAWTRSPEPPQTMKAGGALRGMAGLPLRANGVGPGYTRPTKSGREETPASGSPASLFFLSKSSKNSAAGAASSAPAENPIIPILLGSRFQSFAWARTSRTA